MHAVLAFRTEVGSSESRRIQIDNVKSVEDFLSRIDGDLICRVPPEDNLGYDKRIFTVDEVWDLFEQSPLFIRANVKNSSANTEYEICFQENPQRAVIYHLKGENPYVEDIYGFMWTYWGSILSNSIGWGTYCANLICVTILMIPYPKKQQEEISNEPIS